mmetsp:Transcript_24356/g.51017  ORF Transcript_24356/g.51017 Transcript_24356/m.51017 type:complete len:136 (+) Transcript_24356:42-449(+)
MILHPFILTSILSAGIDYGTSFNKPEENNIVLEVPKRVHLLTMLHASMSSKKINQRRELMFCLFQSGFGDAVGESFDQASTTNVEFFFYDHPNSGSLAQSVSASWVANSLPALTLKESFNYETLSDGHRELHSCV